MKVRVFVTSSAVLLSAWLVACFLRVVPMDTYPTQPLSAGNSALGDPAGETVRVTDDESSRSVVAR